MTQTPTDIQNNNPSALLQITDLHKTLLGNKILDGIDLDVRAGEVHALMGGNGAGKSTLIKCLSGYWVPEQGTITVSGIPLAPNANQIAFVQQDLGLISALTVAENISLGVGFATGPFANIKWHQLHEKVASLLEELGHSDINPRTEIRKLNAVQRTIVAIARAAQGLRDGAKLLVLDEPTASLPVTEIGKLFETLDRLRASGVGMIYVSHHLSEVFELSDRISVLRSGQLVATKDAKDTTEEQIVELMLGKKIDKVRRQQKSDKQSQGSTILALDSLCGSRVEDVSLSIKAGEIIGLAGLQGSGCTELAELIFGAKRATSGIITIDGETVNFRHPDDAMKAGVGMVTEDRHLDGCLIDHTVGENIAITDLGRFFKRGWLSGRAESDEIDRLIRQFDVVPQDASRRFTSLSGGNQQKAVLAKWMRLTPKILICDQPDIGVDIGAKNVIYAALQKAAAAGAAIILISNQYDDFEALCDRVLVMRSGKIVSELVENAITEHAVSLAAIGSVQEKTPSNTVKHS